MAVKPWQRPTLYTLAHGAPHVNPEPLAHFDATLKLFSTWLRTMM